MKALYIFDSKRKKYGAEWLPEGHTDEYVRNKIEASRKGEGEDFLGHKFSGVKLEGFAIVIDFEKKEVTPM